MDITNNSGLIVVSLDGCLPTSGVQNEALKADCLYTVAVMAPEGVLVPNSEVDACVQHQQQLAGNSEVADISQSQDTSGQQVAEDDGGDEDYYSLLLRYLTTQTLPNSLSETRRTMITSRSRHYHMKNGELYYGYKQHKKVICDGETRTQLMRSVHIEERTGVHYGVQKMYAKLKKEYFWCGMYTDLTKYVRYCKSCIDADLPLSSVKMLAHKRKQSSLEQTNPFSFSNIDQPASTGKNDIWKKVELRLCGPYSEDQYIIIIADPVSCWVDAIVTVETDLGVQAADFLASTFLHFGFALVSVVGFSAEQKSSLKETYLEHFRQITKISNRAPSLVTKNLTNFTEDVILCPWIGDMVHSLMHQYPKSWNIDLSRFLFLIRNTKIKACNLAPFYLLFNREPVPSFREEECKENTGRRFSKRLQNSAPKELKQTAYQEVIKSIPSTVQLKRNTRSMTAGNKEKAAELSEDEDDPSELSESSSSESCSEDTEKQEDDTIPRNGNTAACSSSRDKTPVAEEGRASTVAAVQALLSATRYERSRRGKYHRYSLELREEIASYALEHGSLAAVKYFSEKLGTRLCESTIRNFAKTYRTFSVELQEEIGAFATENDVDTTVQHFTAKLGYEVDSHHVRKFKKVYLEKFPPRPPPPPPPTIITPAEKEVHLNPSRMKKKLREATDEIGQFASEFGVSQAMEYFSKKFDMPVKKYTVKRLRRIYEQKRKYLSSLNETTPPVSQSETLQAETMDVMQTSFSVLNQSPPGQTLVYNQQSYQSLMPPISFHQNNPTLDHSAAFQQQQHQQSLPQVMTHNPQIVFSQATFQPHTTYTSTFAPLQSSGIHLPTGTETQMMSSTDGQLNHHQCNNSPMIISQHPIIITHTQGDNNMTMQLENIATNLPTFGSPMQTQHESSNTINFIQPSTLSYDTTLTSSELVQPSQDVNSSSSNFTPVGIIDNNGGQLIRVIRVNCDDRQNLKLIPDMACNANASSIVTSKETAVPSTSNTSPKSASKKKKGKGRIDKKKLKNKTTQKSLNNTRGNYTTYSPEIRADIGKFAAVNGNQQAVLHFRNILGYDLPESTVRGLKEKYLAKLEQCNPDMVAEDSEVTALGFAPRGRPVRLGKYDDLVRKCIHDLVKNGERVTSFLAITTAKQVLTEHEPNLLAENGGNLKLTPNWAKSYLKRIGIHNNS